ncbi:hypothetical protein LLG46_14030 [bacterium]|nr:hypothetical protein [bacterium]
MSVAYTWGTTPEERKLEYACDRFWEKKGRECAFYRGVTINASPEVIYKWLCQIRVAPYSYDWIDNLCRRSPRTLTPGIDDLSIGMHIQEMFEVIDFERDRSITVRAIPRKMEYMRLLDMVVTYMIVPRSDANCRLLVKGYCNFTDDPLGRLSHKFLLWGDLIMMRKQLLNFKSLAQKTRSALPHP